MKNNGYRIISIGSLFTSGGESAPGAAEWLAAELARAETTVACLFGREKEFPADEYDLLRTVQNAAELLQGRENAILSITAPSGGAYRLPPAIVGGRLPALVRAASELGGGILRVGVFAPMRRAYAVTLPYSDVVLIDCLRAAGGRQILEAVLLRKAQPEFFYSPKPILVAASIKDDNEREESRELCAINGALLIDISDV